MIAELAAAATPARPATTLLSLIGRGKRDETSRTYLRTAYDIAGQSIESPFFVHAILRSRWGVAVDEVILLGTRTSSWGALVEEFAANETEIYANLETASEAGTSGPPSGVTDELLASLSELLTRAWARRVRCIAVPDRVDDSTAQAIASQFLAALPIRDPSREVLFDITHGYRSLPAIGLAALQVADAIAPGFIGRARVLYGELGAKPARGLAFPELQVLGAVSNEIRIFLDTLDGEKLAIRLKSVSKSLAGAVEDLSGVAMTNSLRRLGEAVRRMNNALATEGANEPEWLRLVRGRLKELLADMPPKEGPDQLVALAVWRYQRGQTALAILTLSEAVCYLASPTPVDDYQALKDAVRTFSRGFDKPTLTALRNLEALRNQVAHGASIAQATRALSPRALRDGFERSLPVVRRLCGAAG